MSSNRIYKIRGQDLTPIEGQAEPKLWVEQFTIWESPEKVLRKIALRPGLNIIWTPDPTDQPDLREDALANYGGKTTFCRLLRYCLGETTFGCKADQAAIRRVIPHGFVGAQIKVNGKQWSVVRSLENIKRGIIRDTTLASTVDEFTRLENAPDSSVKDPVGCDLSSILATAILGNLTKLMPAGLDKTSAAWGATLAWATRDQKCGYNDHLFWRHTKCESGSPVANLAADKRAAVVRALMGAIRDDEYDRSKELERLEREKAGLDVQNQELGVLIKALYGELCKALNLAADGRPKLEDLNEAVEKLDKTLRKKTIQSMSVDRDNARLKLDQASADVRKLEGELAEVQTRIDERTETVRRLRAGLSGHSSPSSAETANLCPFAESATVDVLPETCPFAGDRIVEHLAPGLNNVEEELRIWSQKRSALEQDVDSARKQLATASKVVERLERGLAARKSQKPEIERLNDRIREFSQLLDNEKELCARIKKCQYRQREAQDGRRKSRAKKTDSFVQFSAHFEWIARELLPGNLAEVIHLVGKRLSPRFLSGGEPLSDAVESIGVIAYDLAALVLSFTAQTYLSGFLVHDCPHGADYGNSIYFRLFDFVKDLERCGDQPLFQYVVTTTTMPPDDVRCRPWLRETLLGSPPERRLLRRSFHGAP